MKQFRFTNKFFLKSAVTLLSVFLSLFILNLLFPLNAKIEYSTIVTDIKGEVVHAFLTSDDKWRMKTGLAIGTRRGAAVRPGISRAAQPFLLTSSSRWRMILDSSELGGA